MFLSHQTRTDCKRCRYQACLKVELLVKKSLMWGFSSPQVGMLPELVDAGLRRRREEERVEMSREFSWRRNQSGDTGEWRKNQSGDTEEWRKNQTTSAEPSGAELIANSNIPTASWQVSLK